MEGNTINVTVESAADVLYSEFLAPWEGGCDIRDAVVERDWILERINSGDSKIYSDRWGVWVKVIDAV